MKVEVWEAADVFETLRPGWSNLLRESSSATPFQSTEWHETWFRHYGKSKAPYILTAHEGADLVGVFPLAHKRGLWSILRSSGTGPADYLHPLAQAGYEERIAEAFSEFLAHSSRGSLLDLHQIRSDRPQIQLEGAHLIEQGTCLVLDLPTTFDDYLAMLGKSLRYDVRKLDKSLFKEGRARIDLVGAEEIGQGLEILFDQHKRRWRKRGLPGAFVGRAQRFHLDWGARAMEKGWLELGILRLDGQPIGAIYTMAMGSTTYFYQAGFDPEFKAVSPGTLLVANMIRRSIELGRRHFDFLRGDEPYKRRWKPQRELKNFRIIAARPGPTGQIGARWNLLGSRIESKIRARLEGKGLL